MTRSATHPDLFADSPAGLTQVADIVTSAEEHALTAPPLLPLFDTCSEQSRAPLRPHCGRQQCPGQARA